MFRNFNWKLYGIRVAIVWASLMLFFGFVSGINAQENNGIWIYYGRDVESTVSFYIQRNSLMLNASGNFTLVSKVEGSQFGSVYTKWEFDCRGKKVRMIEFGHSHDKMAKVEGDWIIPEKDSITHKFIKDICLIGGI